MSEELSKHVMLKDIYKVNLIESVIILLSMRSLCIYTVMSH